MAAQKKHKIASECRRFQTRWEMMKMLPNIRATHRTLVLNEHRKSSKWQLACKLKSSFFFRANKIQENATTASYEVGKLIAQHGKPFSDGDFIMQCLIKVTEIMCPEKVPEFNNVSLSRNTEVWRIEDLSANLKLQLRDKACAFDFYSIACNESTDATDTAQLLIFLRGVDDHFCCTSPKRHNYGKDIFEAVSEAVEKMGLKWDKLCGVTTDGAPAMTGKRKGMASLVCAKESGGEAVRMHCIIHQEALCAKTVQLGDVMNTVIKTVNIIRAKGLYHREFQAFLSDVDPAHSDVRWLSRGSVLQRFYLLRSEIDRFLKEKDRPLHELSDPLWLADLAFLVDLTHHLNTLNKNLQGKVVAGATTVCAHENLLRKAPLLFQRPAFLLKRRHMYFSVNEKQIKLFSTPLLVDAEEVEEDQHQLLSLPEFYQSLDNAKFPLMKLHAKRMMSLFSSTYIFLHFELVIIITHGHISDIKYFFVQGNLLLKSTEP
uniref:DUF4371 domain-containing protein n=1 Tax=Poecilia reticulata TaxID=8081 RepID=A0A3P9NQ89_POERE